jgi:hypothetical protein
VISDAIKESRRIFQRMNSYAIYRIAAETTRRYLACEQPLRWVRYRTDGKRRRADAVSEHCRFSRDAESVTGLPRIPGLGFCPTDSASSERP